MAITQFALIMLFGALVASAGVVLLFVPREQGDNRIRLFGQEFQLSTPALVVFLAGCGLFVAPEVLRMQNQDVMVIPLPWHRATPAAVVSGEEQEPNDQITAPNVISVGSTTRGRISTEQDRDFYRFTSPAHGGAVRIILRKASAGGFYARITVYDAVEKNVASDYALGEDAASLAFDSDPHSDYWIKVEGAGGQRGSYELVVRAE